MGGGEGERLAVGADRIVHAPHAPLEELADPVEEVRGGGGIRRRVGLGAVHRRELLPSPGPGVEAPEGAERGEVPRRCGADVLPRRAGELGVLEVLVHELGPALQQRHRPAVIDRELRLPQEHAGELLDPAEPRQHRAEGGQRDPALRIELEDAPVEPGGAVEVPEPLLAQARHPEELGDALRGGAQRGELALEERAQLLPAPLPLVEPLERGAGGDEVRVEGEGVAVAREGVVDPAEPLLQHLGGLEGPVGLLARIVGRGGLGVEGGEEPVPVPGPGAEPPERGEGRTVPRVELDDVPAARDGLVGPPELCLLELGSPELRDHRLVQVARVPDGEVRRRERLEGVAGVGPGAARLAKAGDLGEHERVRRGGGPASFDRRDGRVGSPEPLLEVGEGEPGVCRRGALRRLRLGLEDASEVVGAAEPLRVAPRRRAEEGIVGEEGEGVEGEGAGAVDAAEPLLEERGGGGEVVSGEAAVGGGPGAPHVGLGEALAIGRGGRGARRLLRGGEGPRRARDGELEDPAALLVPPERREEATPQEEELGARLLGRRDRSLGVEHLGREGVVALLHGEAPAGAQVRDERRVEGERAAVVVEGDGGLAEPLLVNPPRLEEQLRRRGPRAERRRLALEHRGGRCPVDGLAGHRGQGVDAGRELPRD